MTGQLDPNEGNSSPVDATVDPAPAAPGPLFLDKTGSLNHAQPAGGSTAPVSDQNPPAIAPTGPSGNQSMPTVSSAVSMTKAPMGSPMAQPWTGGRSPYDGGSTPLSADSGPETAAVADVPVRPFVALAERPKAVLGSGPAAVFPVPNEPMRAALGTDVVTCPECGQLATVDMARRQADDFCRRCDFPLFWARGTVIAPEGAESGASLRRLPGTVGRAATAALICPHCAEPNSPATEICIRCSLSLHPVDIPEPAPVVIVLPPEPEPEPEPEKAFDWWWIVAIAAAVLAIALLVGLLYLR